jgi:hypothetical protein
MTLKEEIALLREQFGSGNEHPVARLLDFTDATVAALAALAGPMMIHDDLANRNNFVRCGCDYCRIMHPLLAKLDKEV